MILNKNKYLDIKTIYIIYQAITNFINQKVSTLFVIVILITCSFSLKSQIYSDSISVNFFLLDDCLICQKSSPYIEAIYQEFKNDTFHMVAYFPNFVSKPKKIEQFVSKYMLNLPYKTDYFKSRATLLNASVLPEVIVKDEKFDKILYQGRINDLFAGIGQQRRVVLHHDLQQALKAIQNQEIIRVKKTEPVGCLINFGEF